MIFRSPRLIPLCVLCALCVLCVEKIAAGEIDFNRDIRPILSDTCFTCHGPDANKRKSDLRLDQKDKAYAGGKSGAPAIIPGKPDKSEVFLRMISKDDDEVMPPRDQTKRPTPEQIETLKKWIKSGAKYEEHWAFRRVEAPPVPKVKDKSWPKTPLDNFILARLEKEKLKPSPGEERARLIRRVTLDLTGLPPGIEEVNAFVNDSSRDAYEKVVDRLLASPRYGERMTVPWLDLSRYADTAGYHNDSLRDMWLWRDWIVKAFNENKPYSDFTIEQLAGDLVPNATVDQKIASGFNRNVMTSDEGGLIESEYLNLYIVDRVNTTGVTWMGMTVGCSQCHDHKYDPLTQKEYYSLYAFFHNIPESGKDGVRDRNPKPFMRVPSAEQEQKLAQLNTEHSNAEKALAELNKKFDAEFKLWAVEEAKKPAPAEPQGQIGNLKLDAAAEGKVHGQKITFPADGIAGNCISFENKGHFDIGNQFSFEKDQAFSATAWVKIKNNGSGHLFGKLEMPPRYRGWRTEIIDRRVNIQLNSSWDKDVLELRTKEQLPQDVWLHLALAYDGSAKGAGMKLFVNGKAAGLDIRKDGLKGTIVTETPFTIGGPQNGSLNAQIDDLRVFNRTLNENEAGAIAAAATHSLLAIAEASRTAAQTKQLREVFRKTGFPALNEAEKRVADLKKSRDEVEKSIPNTMVMEEMPKPRDTFIKVRGAYDKQGEKVSAATPAFLPPIGEPADGKRLTRLDFARWLIAPENPLTSRVAVNRFWAILFGNGIARTLNDFGMQSEFPSHPELLDWLAADFMRDWDMKRCVKQMVLSAAYRQSSRVTPLLIERDAANRLLARGPRNRLDAEFVRDNALAISGLLNPEMGGKGVYPAQPPGIWEINEMGGMSYKKSTGPAQYRRGIYVYWRRSTPYPSFLTFDAPQREFCVAARARTSTPLQSLVLMNDPVYVEAARAFALRAMKEGGAGETNRLLYMWRAALAREPRPDELQTLQDTLHQQLENFAKDPKAAESLTKIGDTQNPKDANLAEIAAWTAVANVVLNLNETITK